MLTTRDDPKQPLQKSGHACFLSIGDEWYITHLCARPLTERGCCTLGRETAIQKIVWENGWPRLQNGTHTPDVFVPAPKLASAAPQKLDRSETIVFSPEIPLPPSLKTLRGPLLPECNYSLTARPGWLRLYGGQTLSSHHRQTLFARRWESFSFEAETVLDFSPKNFQQVAGLVLFYDTCNWIYAYLTWDEVLESRILRVLRCDFKDFSYGSEAVPVSDGVVTLSVRVERDTAQFFYAVSDGKYLALGGVQPADHLSDDYIETRRARCAFTGAMIGICAQDMDAHGSFADFEKLSYREK